MWLYTANTTVWISYQNRYDFTVNNKYAVDNTQFTIQHLILYADLCFWVLKTSYCTALGVGDYASIGWLVFFDSHNSPCTCRLNGIDFRNPSENAHQKQDNKHPHANYSTDSVAVKSDFNCVDEYSMWYLVCHPHHLSKCWRKISK